MSSYFVPISFLSLLLFHFGTCQTIVTRSEVWETAEDLSKGGWLSSNNTLTWARPSDLDPKLAPLDSLSSTQVFGVYNETSWKINLQWDERIEFCGVTNASVTFSYYLENTASASGSYFSPCEEVSTGKCPLNEAAEIEWTTETKTIKLTDKVLIFEGALLKEGILLIDKITVNYTVNYTTECPFSCNQDCTFVGLDCHNYYACVNFRYKEFFQCPSGLAFNPLTSSCDLVENVQGCDPKLKETSNCGGKYVPTEDCTKYLFCPDGCDLGTCTEHRCPPGLVWTEDAKRDGSGVKQCTLPQNSTCMNGMYFSCKGKENGLYWNEKDCRAFWICEGESLASAGFCPDNFVFNPEIKACDLESKAGHLCEV